MKVIKSVKNLGHEFLVFEDQDKGHFRKGTHYLLSHSLKDQSEEAISAQLIATRDSATFTLPRNLLKSSFTCEVKII